MSDLEMKCYECEFKGCECHGWFTDKEYKYSFCSKECMDKWQKQNDKRCDACGGVRNSLIFHYMGRNRDVCDECWEKAWIYIKKEGGQEQYY